MNILITGSSGTIGRELLKQLSKTTMYESTVFDCDSKRMLVPDQKLEDGATLITRMFEQV
jgi:FlaA1/EpsC-like NDP-sugar epimerase